MTRTPSLVAATLAIALPVVAAEPSAAELTKNARYVESRKLAFQTMTADDAKEAIDVTSGRTYAAAGYNTPVAKLLLPRNDNGLYAIVEIEESSLQDEHAFEVPHEIQKAPFDLEEHAVDLRFVAPGGAGPAEHARAIGNVHVKVPLAIETLVFTGSGRQKDLPIAIDGPYVTCEARPEAAARSDAGPVRAYDAAGHQLASAGTSSPKELEGKERRAFHGAVARVEIDVVRAWASVEVRYDVPAAAPLPSGKAGAVPPLAERTRLVPGARVSKAFLTAEAAPGGAAAPAPARTPSAAPRPTPDEARRLLRIKGFATLNADFFVTAAASEDPETVRLFLDAGIAVDARESREGRTAIFSAASSGRGATVRMLIEQGANVNGRGPDQATVLIAASGRCEAVEAVEALVAAGAELNARLPDGATALAIARKKGCTQIASALEKAGAKSP